MKKKLTIRNLGPLSDVDIELGAMNIIIGTQSSGKSCILKLACYCTWVEKRIMLAPYDTWYQDGGQFINEFVEYYKMKGYVKNDTFVSYTSPYLSFSYDNQLKKFGYKFSSNGWKYTRPKVSYIPSERNIVSLFSDYSSLPNMGTHIQGFMSDWNVARTTRGREDNVLSLGVNYYFDKNRNLDIVETGDGQELELTNTSSGLQSLLPLYVHLDFLTSKLYTDKQYNVNNLPLDKAKEIYKLLEYLYGRIVTNTQDNQQVSFAFRVNNQTLKYWFKDETEMKKFSRYINRLLVTNRTEIFLEEPENNLFPPTQTRLLSWLLERTVDGKRDDTLFIATHSPYILTELLERRKLNLHLFFTYQNGGKTSVKTASNDDIQQIYDYGVDMFFGYESFI